MKLDAATLFATAHNAGNAAVQSATVTPMIVTQCQNPLDDSSKPVRQYFVEDGVCGFASIIVKPANSSFARYLKLHHRAHKSYYGGVSLPVREFNQSLQKKEAYAYAFAQVLNQAGISAYVDSRMD